MLKGVIPEQAGRLSFLIPSRILVHPSAPVRNFREFMEWTKNYKGALNYGSAGHGSGGHLAAELYKMGWYGVLVPARLPKPILTRLYTEFAAIIKQPEAQSRIRSSARTRSAARRRSSGSTCSPTSPSGRRW